MLISHLALSENRCTIQMAGCNFKCKGCFSRERHTQTGVNITPVELAKQIPRDREEVMLAGGEPTLHRKELTTLIDKLDRQKITISTNGYLLDQELLENLRDVTIHTDLKALNPALHRWYTGKDNQSVLTAIEKLYDLDFEFEVKLDTRNRAIKIDDKIRKNEIVDKSDWALLKEGLEDAKTKHAYAPVHNNKNFLNKYCNQLEKYLIEF